LVGGSAGTAVAAALKYAHRLPNDSVVVAILPDTGRNYLSKFFSDEWLDEQGLAEESQPRARVRDVLSLKHRTQPLVSIGSRALVIEAVRTFEQYDISQMPVIDGMDVVGSVNEATLARALHDGVDPRNTVVADVMGAAPQQVEEHTAIAEPYRLLLGGHGGVLVARDGVPIGFLTRYDLLEFWAGAHDETLVVA
jgi:cystathionine beta-synthase